MGLKINGSTSGSIEIDVPAVAGTDTAITIPATTGGEFIVSDASGNVDLGALDISGSAAADSVSIDASGRLLVGTSSTSARVNTIFQGTSGGVAVSEILLARNEATPPDGNTLGDIQFSDNTHTDSASIRAQRDGGTWSASSKPTRLVFSTTADGASSPTERARITSSGGFLIGKTSQIDPTTEGFIFDTGTLIATRGTNRPLIINRQTNDGSLVEFRQANTAEGSITVSGSTVSYNGAHLSRWSQLPSGAERTEILRGSVLSNIDEMCEWAYDAEPEVLWAEGDELPEGVNVGDVKTPAKAAGTEDNEQLNRMKVSDVEGDKNVSGVFQSWDDDDDTYTDDFYCAMTGDFIIRIAQGVTVQRGDLLMSAGDGTAKPQDDDIVRSKTVAKVTSTNVSCTYDDGSYCVPCVLMAC